MLDPAGIPVSDYATATARRVCARTPIRITAARLRPIRTATTVEAVRRAAEA